MGPNRVPPSMSFIVCGDDVIHHEELIVLCEELGDRLLASGEDCDWHLLEWPMAFLFDRLFPLSDVAKVNMFSFAIISYYANPFLT